MPTGKLLAESAETLLTEVDALVEVLPLTMTPPELARDSGDTVPNRSTTDAAFGIVSPELHHECDGSR
jgi:hypothetical protein